jgi:hypothetical protein
MTSTDVIDKDGIVTYAFVQNLRTRWMPYPSTITRSVVIVLSEVTIMMSVTFQKKDDIACGETMAAQLATSSTPVM